MKVSVSQFAAAITHWAPLGQVKVPKNVLSLRDGQRRLILAPRSQSAAAVDNKVHCSKG